MNFIHPATKTPARILRLSALSSRKRKVLVGIKSDDSSADVVHKRRLMHVYIGLDALKHIPSAADNTCVGLLLAAPAEGINEFLTGTNHANMPLIFISRTVLHNISGPIRAENLIILEDMHTSYEYIGPQWNGTIADAIAAIGLLYKTNHIISDVDVIAAQRIAVCGKYGVDILSQFTPERLTVYTQAYKVERGMRRREITEALNHNANNSYVDKVVVFADSAQNVQMDRITGPGKAKIQIVEVGTLKTFRGIWEYIAASESTGFACILKEDCFLDTSVGHIWGMQMADTCLALSRDDYKEERTARDMPTMQVDNQEAWIMRTEDIVGRALPEGALEFNMGAQIYAMAVGAVLMKMRFVLKNPSASIKVHHHHESKIHVGKKGAAPPGDVFIQCAPTMLQDREMISDLRTYALMDSGKQITLEAAAFDRPLLGMSVPQAKTFITMKNRLNRGEDYTWADTPGKNTFRGALGLCKWGNAFVNGDGVVSNMGNVFIGGGSVPNKTKEFPERFWGKSTNYPYGLTSVATAMAAIPIATDRMQDVAKYVLYYFARAMNLRKKLDCNVSAWYNPGAQGLFSSIFRTPADGEALTLVPYNISRSIAATTVYGYEPSEESQWVWREDVSALRSLLLGESVRYQRNKVLLTEPLAGLLDTFRASPDLVEWEFEVAAAISDPKALRASYESAGVVVMTPESAPWQWMCRAGQANVIELQFENKQAVEHLNISNASDLTHYIRILPPRTDDATLRRKQFEAVRLQLSIIA